MIQEFEALTLPRSLSWDSFENTLTCLVTILSSGVSIEDIATPHLGIRVLSHIDHSTLLLSYTALSCF